jgi:hypothetical protein
MHTARTPSAKSAIINIQLHTARPNTQRHHYVLRSNQAAPPVLLHDSQRTAIPPAVSSSNDPLIITIYAPSRISPLPLALAMPIHPLDLQQPDQACWDNYGTVLRPQQASLQQLCAGPLFLETLQPFSSSIPSCPFVLFPVSLSCDIPPPASPWTCWMVDSASLPTSPRSAPLCSLLFCLSHKAPIERSAAAGELREWVRREVEVQRAQPVMPG